MRQRVAVLGAGMMGSSVAILLARSGFDVVLYDRESAPMLGASRWNEGKIHLGFLYAADPSLRTAHRLVAGGLAFRRAVEQLIGAPLAGVTGSDDHFLVHRDSVVGVVEARAYFETLAGRVREHPWARHYLADASHARVRELSRRELQDVAETSLVRAGFLVPERSVSTQWVADRVVDALAAEPRIATAMSCSIEAVTAREGRVRPRYQVRTSAGVDGGYHFVVNALWAGRLAVDATVGLRPRYRWTHRFRASLFVETGKTLDVPSAVLCTGPFGDMKNYTGRDFYLSWYPEGLLACGESLQPPAVPDFRGEGAGARIARIFDALAEHLPPVRHVQAHAVSIRLEGGWVFASGRGSLDDRRSTLHRRDRVGVTRVGNYFSVDTGKYSLAPWIARSIARAIGARVPRPVP